VTPPRGMDFNEAETAAIEAALEIPSLKRRRQRFQEIADAAGRSFNSVRQYGHRLLHGYQPRHGRPKKRLDFNEAETAAIEAALEIPSLKRRRQRFQEIADAAGRSFNSVRQHGHRLLHGYQGRPKKRLLQAAGQEPPPTRTRLFNNGVYIDDFGVTHAELITRLRGGSSVP
jgi:hypothetical protein